MFDEFVRDPEAVDADIRTFHRFHHRAAEAAGEDIFFHGDKIRRLTTELTEKLCVERLHKAHVNDAAGDAFLLDERRRFQARVHHRTDGQKIDFLPGLEDHAFAHRQDLEFGIQRDPFPGPRG